MAYDSYLRKLDFDRIQQDFNPIEYAWNMLQNTIAACQVQAATVRLRFIEERALLPHHKAFRKTEKNVSMDGFRLVLITKDYYDKALEFTRDHFITKEIVNRLTGVKWTNEVEENCLESFTLDMSLMCVCEETSEAAALVRLGIKYKTDSTDLDRIQSDSLRELFQFCYFCDDQADFFGHFGAKEAIHIEALAVAEKYRQRGLATNIVKAAVSMISFLGIYPVFIKIAGSSEYSKRVFEDAGFETLSEVPFDTWEFPVQITRTSEHTSQKNYGLKITESSDKKMGH